MLTAAAAATARPLRGVNSPHCVAEAFGRGEGRGVNAALLGVVEFDCCRNAGVKAREQAMPAGGQGCNPLSSIPLDFQSHREEPAIQRADVNELPHFLWATLYFLSSRLLVCLPRASHNPPGRLVPWMQQLKSGPPHSANSCRFQYIKNFRDRILLCPKPTGSSTLSWRAGLRCAQTRLVG